jgi:hypothetical protein
MFNKYQWYDETLHKKSKLYNNLAFLMMALTLVCLYLLPMNLRILNLAFIGGGVLFIILSTMAQSKDKKLRDNDKKDIR